MAMAAADYDFRPSKRLRLDLDKDPNLMTVLRRRPSGWDLCTPLKKSEGFAGKEADLASESNRFPSGEGEVISARHEDDKDGHFVFECGENITSRYKIISQMGEGQFGRVLECWDRQAKEYVAIKMIRGVKKYREAALIEIDVLHVLAKSDLSGSRGCVRLKDSFDYRNHACLVFERLGPSLYEFMKKNSYRPYPVDVVKEFGRQLLKSVAYLHELNLIHTDLKPENILLVSGDHIKVAADMKSTKCKRVPKSSEIRLIDFGSATFKNDHHSSVVSTRHYRAPEVILGLGWSYSCDIWSVGCILIELCTGDTLFQTHENLEHLAMMERVLGRIPRHLVKEADRRYEKYFIGEDLNWPQGATSRESIRAVRKLQKLENMIMEEVKCDSAEALALINLLEGLLAYDPFERLTARQALRHPFFVE